MRLRYGNAPTTFPGITRKSIILKGKRRHMVKPEWGTKRSCPKCAERFYDLGKDDPVTCIQCGVTFEPERILKSKQAVGPRISVQFRPVWPR